MRKNVLPITAGVLGSLALAVSASADFTGWKMVNKGQYDTAKAFGGPNVGVVDVWNLYLNFDNPNDTLNSIFVVSAEPFTSMVHSSDLKDKFDGLGGGFWNWSFGSNRPLIGAFYDLDPAAASADTYITIGVKSASVALDAAFFAPGSEGILVDSGILNGSGVINEDFADAATPADIQVYPMDGRVLVLQVAVLRGENPPRHLRLCRLSGKTWPHSVHSTDTPVG